MTKQHPITPPPELVQEWASESLATQHLCTQAARWGADRELDECCHQLRLQGFDVVDDLLATRRPTPLSLKQQALATLEEEPEADDYKELLVFDIAQVELIRRALEALPDD